MTGICLWPTIGAAFLATCLFSGQIIAEETSESTAAENLSSYAEVLSGGGDLWAGYGDFLSGRGDALRGYGEIIRAQGEYIRMVAEARLAWAQARLVEAQAEGMLQRVRHYALMINRLERELRGLLRAEALARRDIERIETNSRRLSSITTGRLTQYSFQAMRVMTIRYIPLTITNQIMTVEFPELDADNFIPTPPQTEAQAFPGGNYGQLWTFLERNRYSLEPWGKAHIAVMLGIEAFDVAAEQEVAKFREYIQGLRQGLYDIWHAPEADVGS